jgi:hypothetical protein
LNTVAHSAAMNMQQAHTRFTIRACSRRLTIGAHAPNTRVTVKMSNTVATIRGY